MILKLPEREPMGIEEFILDYTETKTDDVVNEEDITDAYESHVKQVIIDKAINSLVDEGKATVKMSDEGEYMIKIHEERTEDDG